AANYDFEYIVELRGANNGPRHVAFAHDGFRGQLRFEVGVADAIDAHDGHVDDVSDARRLGELEQAPRSAHVDRPAAQGLACGRGGLGDDLHSGERFGEARARSEVALNGVDVAAR